MTSLALTQSGKHINVSSPEQKTLNESSNDLPARSHNFINVTDHNSQLHSVLTIDVKGCPDGKPFIILTTTPGSNITCLSTIDEVI